MKILGAILLSALLTGCIPTAPGPSRQADKATINEKAVQGLIERFYTAYGNGEQTTVLSMITEDALIMTFEGRDKVILRKKEFAAKLPAKLERMKAMGVTIKTKVEQLVISDDTTAEAQALVSISSKSDERVLREKLRLKRIGTGWLIDSRTFEQSAQTNSP